MTNTTTTVTDGATVTLHYTGTFDDGTEFDNSRTRGEPVVVTVGGGQLIKGFETALIADPNRQTPMQAPPEAPQDTRTRNDFAC